MVEFAMSWWQFALLTLGGNMICYLAGVVIGKQSVISQMLLRQQQMPQMPQMPPVAGR